MVARRIDPLGLVMKAGEWYLVARPSKGTPRTYRLSNIQAISVARGGVRRPRDFDLAAYWQHSIERFEAGLYRGTACVRATAAGLEKLRHNSAAVAQAVERATRAKGAWTTVEIPIESIDHAAGELLRIGPDVEVLRPAQLRERLAQAAKATARLYAPRRKSPTRV